VGFSNWTIYLCLSRYLLLSSSMIDPLAEIVALLHPRAVGSKLISGAGRWAVQYEDFGQPSFCTVIEGRCRLQVKGENAVALEAGDFILLPTTPGFILSGFEPTQPKVIDPRTNPRGAGEVRHGRSDGPPDVLLLGGYFELESPDTDLLKALLPGVLHIRGMEKLSTLVKLVGEEAQKSQPGRSLILERLVEVLLIEALRLSQGVEAPPGLLRGLGEDRLAEVIRQMHDDPARLWTTSTMAAIAAISRSAFCGLFTRTVGIPPMKYLLVLRMALAKNLLRRRECKLDEIAHRVGYVSASTFSMAFCKHFGHSPGRFAREFS